MMELSSVQLYYNILSEPVLTDINIKYKCKNANILSLTKSNFPILFKGNDIIIAGKIRQLDKPKNDVNENKEGEK